MELISLIIPCHNEEGNIVKLMDSFTKTLVDLSVNFEYIFVNDGSNDRTIDIIDQLASEQDNIKIIDFSRNFGKEAAILAGLDYCVGDAAIIIDADLQMPVKYIIDFIEQWRKGNKLVLSFKQNRSKGFKSYLASKYYDVFNRISETQILKDALDFQLMDREVIDVICSMRERSRFFKGITGFIGYDYQVIPVEIENRVSGNSDFSGLSGLFSYAFKSFAIHSDVPLKIAIKVGAIIASISFIYLFYILFDTLKNGNPTDGYASTITIMLFMFSIIILFLGIIGYYLGLVYNELKQRPNYIIKNSKNIDKK